MPDFRDSVARLTVSGQHLGSAWLITPSVACTANHCVVDCELNSDVGLAFPSANVTGTLIEKDVDLDIALIHVDSASHAIVPLELIARPIVFPPSKPWELHGYPVQNAKFHESGLTLAGSVRNARAGTTNGPLMQLYCEEGSRLGDQSSPFGGVSGCPIVVRPRDSEEAVFVIGVTSHHHWPQDDILFCTPIDELIVKFGPHLQDAQLKSWDAYHRVLSVVRDDHGFRTNLDEHMLQSIWQDGLTNLWCNVMPDESPILTSAIERIVVQAPFATARPNTDLHFVGAEAWKSRCERCAADWVPVDGVPTKKTLANYTFVEVTDQPVPLGGSRFNDLNELANRLKSLCNDWALKRLRGRVSQAFDNPRGELQYDVAADLIVPMRNLWSEWLQVLTNDANTLHHFFGLMLSGDGGVLMAESAAGTGPETIDACILRSTIFSLAVCVALPTQIQSPRGRAPGNLGLDEMSGHSCGIQTLSGKRIQMAEKSHKWKTLFVFLSERQIPWEVSRVAEKRLDVDVEETGNSFNHEPANSLVLPGDHELMSAIEKGRDALKALLEKRYSDFLLAQEQYVAGAKDVDV